MPKLRRAASVLAGSAVLVLLGSTSAAAFNWGTLNVYDGGVLRGQGYGQFNYYGFSDAKLVSTLNDKRVDNMRTFVSATGSAGPGTGFGIQSGRRADGGTAFARMYDVSVNRSAIGTYKVNIYVCMDKNNAFDPCSVRAGN